MDYGEDARLGTVKSDVAAMEESLKKLDQQEQKYTAELKVLYDSLKTAPDRRFEVYAVGYESDVPKWKKYVKDHQLPFINVGGPNVNIDYQEAYNVHGAPTMIILNEKRDIIMNKLIPISSILSFLDNYEKRNK